MLKQALLIISAAVLVAAQTKQAPTLKAGALLLGAAVTGQVNFTQLADGKVRVQGSFSGLDKGMYGFHVHEKGDLSGACVNAGGHFNPEKKEHGSRTDANRHVGDLGNIVFLDNKTSTFDFTDSKISLTGPNSILGRAVVLHEREDDLGRTNHTDSKKTGNAGGRLACGVIGILEPTEWKTNAAASSITTAILMPLVAFLLFMY